MPYIKREDRERVMDTTIRGFVPANGGELQYVIAKLIHNHLVTHGINYATCGDFMGALIGAHSEFYRMVVAPYENEKITDNGRVYLNSPYPTKEKY